MRRRILAVPQLDFGHEENVDGGPLRHFGLILAGRRRCRTVRRLIFFPAFYIFLSREPLRDLFSPFQRQLACFDRCRGTAPMIRSIIALYTRRCARAARQRRCRHDFAAQRAEPRSHGQRMVRYAMMPP